MTALFVSPDNIEAHLTLNKRISVMTTHIKFLVSYNKYTGNNYFILKRLATSHKYDYVIKPVCAKIVTHNKICTAH